MFITKETSKVADQCRGIKQNRSDKKFREVEKSRSSRAFKCRRDIRVWIKEIIANKSKKQTKNIHKESTKIEWQESHGHYILA